MDHLALVNITKIYPNGVVANDHVNFALRRGEIHAIIGENGAGKSTVMKVLYGLEKKDGGEVLLDGKRLTINSPLDAIAHHIGMVPQHSMLIDEMTVSENIFLGIEQTSSGLLDAKAMKRETLELGKRYNLQVDPLARCADLSVSQSQKVSILKSLVRGAEILILDEPTAVLAPQETQELFAQLKLLKSDGYSISIITHKLKEIKQLCDRVTIMRAGRNMGVFDVADVSEEQISRLMIGGSIDLDIHKSPAQPAAGVLQVEHLCVARDNGTFAVDDVSFAVRQGEILCFAGVEGNGQRETVRCINGLEKKYQGRIELCGEDIRGMNIKGIRAQGLSVIPEDRLKTGANGAASILDNLSANVIDQHTPWGVIQYRKLRTRAGDLIRRFDIKAENLSQPLNALSGGNMQKVIVAREISADFALLVADQPTRGVDIGATHFIHRTLVTMRDAGKAILLVSSDINEVLNLADRILVFYKGQITAEISDVKSLGEEQLGRYMLGLEKKR